jgi:NMD protein affecting ribosome stability and mRNA decay
MDHQSHPAGFRPIRLDRLQLETVKDSYKAKGKLSEPAVCTDCGAVFQAGRWQWLAKPEDAHQTICPACHRVRDHFPAGYITLAGDFFNEHEQEILQLMHNRETQEKAQHPLQRIMAIEKTKEGTLVTTTDIHLARGIGEALHHAYQGELELHYNKDENLLRVGWSR